MSTVVKLNLKKIVKSLKGLLVSFLFLNQKEKNN